MRRSMSQDGFQGMTRDSELRYPAGHQNKPLEGCLYEAFLTPLLRLFLILQVGCTQAKITPGPPEQPAAGTKAGKPALACRHSAQEGIPATPALLPCAARVKALQCPALPVLRTVRFWRPAQGTAPPRILRPRGGTIWRHTAASGAGLQHTPQRNTGAMSL